MDLGRRIREELEAALARARDEGADSLDVAAAVNVGGDGRVTTACTDGEVRVVERDGKVTVTRRRASRGEPPGDGGGRP